VKRALALLVVAMLAAACGDDNPSLGGMDGMGSGSGSGSGSATLTSYVIDLVTNHTTATELAKPYTDFSTLPDPDGDSNNGSAYAPLFP
jgi:hypothetical protein